MIFVHVYDNVYYDNDDDGDDDDDDDDGKVNMIYVHEMTEDEALLAIVQY